MIIRFKDEKLMHLYSDYRIITYLIYSKQSMHDLFMHQSWIEIRNFRFNYRVSYIAQVRYNDKKCIIYLQILMYVIWLAKYLKWVDYD